MAVRRDGSWRERPPIRPWSRRASLATSWSSWTRIKTSPFSRSISRHALRSRVRDAERVFEIHPEMSFCVLNDDRPMVHPKRTGLGFTERLALVETHFPGAFDHSRRTHSRSVAADDDILDALAALWTARRLGARQARAIPAGEVQYDGLGLPMAIWA